MGVILTSSERYPTSVVGNMDVESIDISKRVVTSAVNQFASFMDNVLGGIKTFDDVPEDILCNKETWQLFAGHLKNRACKTVDKRFILPLFMGYSLTISRKRLKSCVSFCATSICTSRI